MNTFNIFFYHILIVSEMKASIKEIEEMYVEACKPRHASFMKKGSLEELIAG